MVPSPGKFIFLIQVALIQHPSSRTLQHALMQKNHSCASACFVCHELYLSPICSARMPESSWDFSMRLKPGKCSVRYTRSGSLGRSMCGSSLGGMLTIGSRPTTPPSTAQWMRWPRLWKATSPLRLSCWTQPTPAASPTWWGWGPGSWPPGLGNRTEGALQGWEWGQEWNVQAQEGMQSLFAPCFLWLPPLLWLSWAEAREKWESYDHEAPMSGRAVTMAMRSGWQEVKWGIGVNDNIDALFTSTPWQKWQKYDLFWWLQSPLELLNIHSWLILN